MIKIGINNCLLNPKVTVKTTPGPCHVSTSSSNSMFVFVSYMVAYLTVATGWV